MIIRGFIGEARQWEEAFATAKSLYRQGLIRAIATVSDLEWHKTHHLNVLPSSLISGDDFLDETWLDILTGSFRDIYPYEILIRMIRADIIIIQSGDVLPTLVYVVARYVSKPSGSGSYIRFPGSN